MIKFNLQHFAEEEPEAPVDSPVENAEGPEQQAEPNEDGSQPNEEGEATPDYTDFLNAINEKAVYKGDKMNIDSFDYVIDAVQMKENYQPTHDRMTKAESRVNELENSAEKKYFDNHYKEQGFETFEDYHDAIILQKLKSEGMSEERAIEHIEGQKALNGKKETQRLEQIEKDKENLDVNNHSDAIKWYSDKGYGDLTADKISDETWKKVEKGVPLRYALMEQMFDNVKGDVQQDTLKKLQNKKEKSVPSVDNTNSKQQGTVWDLSDAEFDKQRAKIKRGY